MIDIGILGLDTSHASEFASILENRDRARVSAVWDGQDVHDVTYLDTFCSEYDVPACERPEDMIDDVDGVIVSTVDWSTHHDLAVPFLRESVPTLVDKPIAGSLAQIAAIEDAATSGDVPLFGGSAVAFHPSIDRVPPTESTRTVFCSGYDHSFYYGAHLVDTARRLVDADWTEVEVNDAPGASVDVAFEDGSFASFQFDGADAKHTFGFLVADDHRTETVSVESNEDELDRMYRSYIDAFLECIEGERAEIGRFFDAATLLVGIQAALETGETITPGCGTLSSFEVNGADFLSNYSPYY